MRLGEAPILLPLMAVVVVWLGRRAHAWPLVASWVGLTALAAMVTTATKVAFLGFGLGYAPWDYTGTSGHALFSSAILPMLALLAFGHRVGAHPWRAVALGVAVAMVVSYGRVHTHAHSWSEALYGAAMGLFAVLWPMARFGLPTQRAPRWMPTLVLSWLVFLSLNAPRSPTHDWVTAIALKVSGHSQPYQRRDWHAAYAKRMQATPPAPAASGASAAPP